MKGTFRYACKRLESQNSMDTLLKRPREAKFYGYPAKTAAYTKPANTIESELKWEVAMRSNHLKSNKHYRIRAKFEKFVPPPRQV